MYLVTVLLITLLSPPRVSAAPAQPVRMMKVEGTITKSRFAYSPLEMKSEKVCDVSGEAPVYAPLGGSDSASSINLGACETDIHGEKVNVDTSVIVMLEENLSVDVIKKSATVTLTFYKKGRDPIYTSASAGVDDPTSKNLRVFLTSQAFRGPEKRRIEEVFALKLTFKEVAP